MSEQVSAFLQEIDGQIVLVDAEAVALLRALSKEHCQRSFAANADRLDHFKRRMAELRFTPADVVIVLLSINDANGAKIAEVLMPGHNWEPYRSAGQAPFARGLAVRSEIQQMLETLDKEAANKLRSMTDGVAAVVVDYGVAEVFPA